MLDYNILTKLAQEAARQQQRERPTIEAVFLIGSVARRDSAFPNHIDIDLLLVDYDAPRTAVAYPFVWLSEQVLVHCHTIDANAFQDKKNIRVDPLLAPMLNDAISLLDPRHLLDVVQAGLRSRFWDAETTYQRAHTAYQTALQSFRQVARYSRVAAPTPLPLADLNTLLQVAYASSLAIFNIAQRPAFGRAHWQTLAQVCQTLQRPDLWQHTLAVFGSPNAERTAALYTLWRQLAEAERLHPSLEWETGYALETREHYWHTAFSAFDQANTPEFAAPLLIQEIQRIFALPYATDLVAAEQLSESAAYQQWLTLVGRQDSQQMTDGVQAARHLIEALDDLLRNWAEKQNIPF